MEHKKDLLREFRRSMYRTCSVRVPCFGRSKSSIAVQNIAVPIALMLYEQLQVQHSYGKLICRRCREDVMKRSDSVRYVPGLETGRPAQTKVLFFNKSFLRFVNEKKDFILINYI